ncbi:hypothetical protein LCGC14_1279870 [marine sediment metagenome]|uniref:Uncharacterized protein n=1 Tax=marine sediment metagenome TaxID=412755 RepID=A0A0F9KXE3_9ZZZZ
MKLTKKKALEIAIELWTWIVDNPGKKKEDWPKWEEYGDMRDCCSLCERYIRKRIKTRTEHGLRCDCPIADKHDHCTGTAYRDWDRAMNEDGKEAAHSAAVEFLAQLKDLK